MDSTAIPTSRTDLAFHKRPCNPDGEMNAFKHSGKLVLLTLLLGASLATIHARQQAIAKASVPALLRWPYLQQVSADSAHIIWATDLRGNPSLEYGISRATPTEVGIISQIISTPSDQHYQHTAVLNNLQPNSWYYYSIYDDNVNLTPDSRRWFQTAPETGDLTFATFGDSGAGSPEQYQVRDQMLSRWRDIDLILHTGDLAYPSGTYAEFQQFFFEPYRDLLAFRPIFPTMGNHEYLTDNGQPYLDFFDLPKTALDITETERYYSFNWGYAHFVALDSETPLQNISESSEIDMVDWLETDLTGDNHIWTIAIIHRPLYSSSPTHPETDVRQKLAPIFEAYGVDLVLSGHNHNYERTHAIHAGARSTLKDGGVVYIVTGGGGGTLYPVPGDWFTAAKAKTHHYVQVDVRKCIMKIMAIDKDGNVIDRAVLDKCPHQAYLPLLP
jgi:predicted MPP superfamily phosphohydrolase